MFQKLKVLPLIFTLLFVACSSDDLPGELQDAITLIEGVDRQTIDVSRFGINAFANQAEFGSICEQYADVAGTLGLRHVRVLLRWDDNLQPAPGASFNFSFFNEILNCLPNGVDALVIVEGAPSWFGEDVFIDGNPRQTVAELFLRRIFNRFGDNGKISAFQVWNEPNNAEFPDNARIGVLDSPANYVELLAFAYSLKQELGMNKPILNGATTGIAQNFPATLDYTQAMRDNGIEDFIDIWGVHYYGTNFENLLRSGGVADFLNSLGKPIWITETGRQGHSEQLGYVEQVLPFLRENVSAIDRIYYFQYASAVGSEEQAFGLRSLDASSPTSDLYEHLRERAS